MSVQVILLEKVENLGVIGDTVSVKPGYARNFLLPQGKALRATNENIAYFEKEKAAIEKVNAEKRKEAEKVAKKLEGLTVNLIRQASEGGQLYGGITATDIAEAIATKDVSIRRGQVDLNQSFKSIGLFSVNIVLHPEVVVPVQLNIARSEDEAAIQLKTGKALVAAGDVTVQEKTEELEESLLDDSALKAKKAAEEAEAQAAEEQAEKDAKAAAKKAAKAEEEAAAAEATEETASEEE
ncbi:MAG: 50S ribosomal protein L9 [Micavibrio sp.]|nr:50S ribosomal protein L9 [Micavibrio sp.]|tara:strand:+ start:705 stop:1421 length:717 start_codon:yes stop_codon:yes gene_type:complete